MQKPPSNIASFPSPRRAFLKTSATGIVSGAALFGCAHSPTNINSFFDVRSFGALGDGKADDTVALQKALAACMARGGGTVFVPAGNYKIRPIRLGSRTVLHLDAGAVLLGSSTLTDYP